jgi:hypothetical protein
MKLSLSELRDLAERHGFPDPDTAAAVAMAESAGDAKAVGDLHLGISHGLWQINLRAHPEYAHADLFDPDTNARAAFSISQGGTNWRPWSTFNSNAYKAYMPGPMPEPAPTKDNVSGEDFFDDEESDA